jgi:hypothetical protein
MLSCLDWLQGLLFVCVHDGCFTGQAVTMACTHLYLPPVPMYE